MTAQEWTSEEQELIEALVSVTQRASNCCKKYRPCCRLYTGLLDLIVEFAPDRVGEFVVDFPPS